MKVKIREEANQYLVYFIDSRRMVETNEVGSNILDLFFNEEKNLEEIANIIANKYVIPSSQAKDDAIEFLKRIKKEINPETFNVLEQEQLKVPLGVELEITTACNLRCLHCFQDNYDEVYMPAEKAIDIICQLADCSVCEISIIGGEPFKHPGLIQILKYCQSRDLAINLVTNATLIDNAMAEILSKIKRLAVIVSLDGLEAIHDSIRGKNVFKKADAVLRQLCLKDISVETICTLNSLNLPLYQEVVEYCNSLDIPCNFNLFKPFRPDHQALIPDPNLFFETIIELMKLRNEKKYKLGLSNAAIVAELLGLPDRNECRATKSGMVIDVSGKMVTCPSLVAAGYYTENELPLFDSNFINTWQNHETFVRFRHNGFQECQARAFIFNGDVHGRDPYGITAFREYRRNVEKK